MSKVELNNEENAEQEHEGDHEELEDPRLISLEQVDQIWNSQDPLGDLFNLYTTFFNPSHDYEYDIVDDNKIRFLAEFQIYNLIFCKNDLKLEDVQTVEVLHILWNLLAINQDGTIQDHSVCAEGNIEEALSSKFEQIKSELIDRAKQGILSKDQLKQTVTHMKQGYFKHFRLVDYCLRNRQLPTLKNLTLFHDEPQILPNLGEATEMVEESIMHRAEGEEGAEGEEDDIDVDKDPLDGLEDRLDSANLDDESKQQVRQKLEGFKDEVNQKIEAGAKK